MLPCALSVDKISSISFAFAPSVTLKLKAQCDTEKASYWVRTSAKEESQHFNGAENREFCPACLQSTMLRTFMYVLYNCVTLCNIYNRQNRLFSASQNELSSSPYATSWRGNIACPQSICTNFSISSAESSFENLFHTDAFVR